MRTPLNENKRVETKTPSKEKGGLLVRLPIKKIYCNNCLNLVRGKAQNFDNSVQIICPKCGQSLWSWSHTSWRSLDNETGSSH